MKTFKVHIRPTGSQAKRIDHWIDISRCVYNLAKEVKEYAYHSHRVSISKFDMIKQLPGLKNANPWLKDMDSQALQAVIERLYNAYDRFFEGAGYPQWAKKGIYSSFLCKKGQIVGPGLLQLPKLGVLRFKDTWGLDGSMKIKTVTVKKEGSRYFACITAAYQPMALMERNNTIGVDMGVRYLIATSDGRKIEPSIRYTGYATKLRRLQRKLARQKKFGANWKKTKYQIGKLHIKVANTRKDHLHKVSTRLINENQVIIIEDLKLKNATRSAKGTRETPGTNVKAKSGLNRSMLNAGLGMLTNMLKYKAEWYGREVIQVDPKYTSQMCHACGHVEKQNRHGERFVCKSCGHQAHADINAAKNIWEKGVLPDHQRKAVA